MFETYVINLKQDMKRFLNLEKEMEKRNVKIKRYDAIYGKEIKDFSKYDKYMTKYCQYFGPYGMVGCGLSHYTLLDKIYNLYKKGEYNEYTLILEDDAVPLFNDKSEIEEIIKNIPKDCDTLLLYCQGQCGYDDKNSEYKLSKRYSINIIGGCVAYIVKNSSIPKFLEKRLTFHVDIQWYNTNNIKAYIYYKPLFSVTKDKSYNFIKSDNFLFKQLDNIIKIGDNMTLSEALSYKIFRIPFINKELTSWDMILIIILIIIIIGNVVVKN